MVRIHQDRKRDVLSEFANGIGVLIDCRCDDDKIGVALGVKFVLQCLPPGQVEGTTSPTREGDKQPLLAAVVGQRRESTTKIR